MVMIGFLPYRISFARWWWHGLSLLATVMLALTVWVMPVWATAVYEVPRPAADTWVVDQAEILSRITEGKINTQLRDLAQATDNAVHIVTIRRLDYGDTIDSFTEKLFEAWFPAAETRANQTLLVIDSVTNNTAIRTGATVQTQMADDIATSVAQETVQVPLRQGDRYNQALLDATDRLVAVLSGNPDPGPPVVEQTVQVEGTFATPEETRDSNAMVWVIVLLAVATIVPMATYYFYVFMQGQ